MTKPIEKPRPQPLVHHPSDVLDVFGSYDATNVAWLDFDDTLSQQIQEFEANHPQYIKAGGAFNQRAANRR